MRLFRLEIKRIMKSRRTLILLAVLLLLSVVMAWLPVSFESINRLDEHGNIVELDGLEAIRFKKEYREKTYGEVTPQKVADALRTYQSFVSEYGTVDDVPLDIYTDHIMAIRPLLQGLPEAFADPDTGIGADLMDIDPNEVKENYYEKCASHLNDVMNMEQEDHPSAKEYATEKYGEVERPFHLNSGLSRDAFDYIELYILVLAILCTAIAAPVFANEYQTGSDSIFRCAKHGRMRLAITRIVVFGCIFIGTFIVGTGILISILNLCFGTDCLKTSMQMLFSIINLPDYNLGQLQIILAAAGLLSVIASMSCTMFLSAKCKDSATALLLSIVVLLLPAISYIAIGGSTWVSTILPSAGIGMQNNYLYQLINFNFLHVGDLSLWTPHVILVSAAIEIPVFLLLAVRSYCKHRIA